MFKGAKDSRTKTAAAIKTDGPEGKVDYKVSGFCRTLKKGVKTLKVMG